MTDTNSVETELPFSGTRILGNSTELERLRAIVVAEPDDIAVLVAERICEVIDRAAEERGICVLGLATGSTPLGIYRELIRRHLAGGVDFARVATFNLDEYYPIQPDNLHSYRRFMEENFFQYVNVPPDHVHIPDGTVARSDLAGYCEQYEKEIAEIGGIDFQIFGIGRSGHIGFDEPGSSHESRTRLITLDTISRKDAASDFFGEVNVPTEAITMGIASILDAREIALIATGEHKAPIVRRAVEEAPSADVTASYLQRHPAATVWLDREAASEARALRLPGEPPGQFARPQGPGRWDQRRGVQRPQRQGTREIEARTRKEDPGVLSAPGR
jgi:glucosamine-6-phosphate deaminase